MGRLHALLLFLDATQRRDSVCDREHKTKEDEVGCNADTVTEVIREDFLGEEAAHRFREWEHEQEGDEQFDNQQEEDGHPHDRGHLWVGRQVLLIERND